MNMQPTLCYRLYVRCEQTQQNKQNGLIQFVCTQTHALLLQHCPTKLYHRTRQKSLMKCKVTYAWAHCSVTVHSICFWHSGV